MSIIEFSAEEKKTIEEAMEDLISACTPFQVYGADKPYLNYLDNLLNKIKQWQDEDKS